MFKQKEAKSKVLESMSMINLRYLIFLGFLVGIIAFGFNGWFKQLQEGLVVTGMNTPAYWGIYIANFVFFVGLSAGGILVAAIAHAFNIERFRPLARIAEVIAISCLMLAMLVILFDMGRPDRIFNLFLHPQFNSPLIWDVIVILLYLGLAMILGYLSVRKDLIKCMNVFPQRRWLYNILTLGYADVSFKALERDKKIIKVLAIISIPGAILLHSVTAWILGLVKAVPGWHSAILAPIFIGSAFVSGIGLVIVATILMRKFFNYPIKDEIIHNLGRILCFLIPVLGYFLFSELLTVMYAAETGVYALFKEMMFGSFAPIFWFDLIIGIIAPLLLLVFFSKNTKIIGVAGALVVLGVLAERINIVILPLLNRGLMPYPQGFYFPTQIEIFLMLALYALGILIVSILAKVFPLAEIPEN